MSMEPSGVLVAFVLMVVSNTLSTKRVFGGKDNKDISDAHPTYVTPDGATFAIWGLIYLMLLVTTVCQFFTSPEEEAVLQKTCPLTGLDMRARLVLAFLMNALWLPIFSFELFWSAFVIMVAYLAFLLSYFYSGLSLEGLDALKLGVGVSMNASWIVIASAVNVFFCLGEVGWKDEQNVAGSVGAGQAVCIAVAVIGIYCGVALHDPAWGVVAAHGLRGIYRMQAFPDDVRFPSAAMSVGLASTAKVCSYIVLAATVCSFFAGFWIEW